MNKKRLKKTKKKPELTLRQKRIIRTKEKMLLKKELAAHGVEVNSKNKKKKITKTASKGGCGGCRRKKKRKG
jgi:hypothetical protein